MNPVIHLQESSEKTAQSGYSERLNIDNPFIFQALYVYYLCLYSLYFNWLLAFYFGSCNAAAYGLINF